MAACGAQLCADDEKVDKQERLFNYKPFGQRSPEYKEMPNCSDEEVTTEEYVKSTREMMAMATEAHSKGPMFAEPLAKTDITEITIKKGAINDCDFNVFVLRPKRLPEKKCAAMIFAHGGGAVAGTAKQFNFLYAYAAYNYGVVGFNVDYRLAPEHGNKGSSDVYATLKYVYENADSLGVDKTRIGIEGQGVGAHHMFNACHLMVKKRDTGMCRMMISEIGMFTSRLKFTPKDELDMKEEKLGYGKMDIALQCLAGDNYKKWLDDKHPMLFPDLVDEDILKRYPPVVFFSPEFCFFNRATKKFADRLDKVGKLNEFRLIRGLGHMYTLSRNQEVADVFKDRVISVETYLKN